ncbi:hypothetical protein BCM40_01530 [Planococcus donghaensis]|uniref:Uncharacterized protein n=1 Tax=Planococcus donghaensis TaxID=414778 RepID=A0A1C7EFC1_9BACL|nr:hypothetical protein BCM40_01530 [Planococcus donghaensis]
MQVSFLFFEGRLGGGSRLGGSICAMSVCLRTVLEKYARSRGRYARRKKFTRGGEAFMRVPQKIRANGSHDENFFCIERSDNRRSVGVSAFRSRKAGQLVVLFWWEESLGFGVGCAAVYARWAHTYVRF